MSDKLNLSGQNMDDIYKRKLYMKCCICYDETLYLLDGKCLTCYSDRTIYIDYIIPKGWQCPICKIIWSPSITCCVCGDVKIKHECKCKEKCNEKEK